MLKKILNIFLIFALLFSTTGITVYSHYCSGYLVEKSIYVNPEGCCKGPCNCCHTDVLSAKVTDSFIDSKLCVNFDEIVKELVDYNKYPVLIKSAVHDVSLMVSYPDEVYVWLLHPLLSTDRNSLLCVFLT